jgi:hypothetical protein
VPLSFCFPSLHASEKEEVDGIHSEHGHGEKQPVIIPIQALWIELAPMMPLDLSFFVNRKMLA